MKKHGFKSWVFSRIEAQQKLTKAAAAGMAVAGVVLFLLQAGFLYLIFSAAYSQMTGLLVVTGIFGLMLLYVRYQAGNELRDTRHKTICGDRKIMLSVAPAISQIWAWAFGSMDPDRSVIEKGVGIAMLVPRLFYAAWYTWHRIDDVQNIDPDTTLTVMKTLFRSEFSVSPQNIAAALDDDADVKKAIRDVSLLDGIVFLTKDGLSLSVAPRLHEDLEAWRAKGREESEGESLFNG